MNKLPVNVLESDFETYILQLPVNYLSALERWMDTGIIF